MPKKETAAETVASAIETPKPIKRKIGGKQFTFRGDAPEYGEWLTAGNADGVGLQQPNLTAGHAAEMLLILVDPKQRDDLQAKLDEDEAPLTTWRIAQQVWANTMPGQDADADALVEHFRMQQLRSLASIKGLLGGVDLNPKAPSSSDSPEHGKDDDKTSDSN